MFYFYEPDMYMFRHQDILHQLAIQKAIYQQGLKSKMNPQPFTDHCFKQSTRINIPIQDAHPMNDTMDTLSEPSEDLTDDTTSSCSELDSIRTSMATTKIQRWFRKIQAKNARKALKTLHRIEEKLNALISESSIELEQHPEWIVSQLDEFYRVYGEKLLRLFLELDNVASHGHYQVRNKRKSIANEIEKVLTFVDGKRNQ